MRKMFSKSEIETIAEDIANSAIQADKDIIEKIVVEYDEEGDYTNFIFPKGVMPLSITLNTHELYLKDNDLVGNDGQEIEGYSFSEYIYLDDENKLVLTIDGDLSEQVINNLVYICFNGKPVAILNTYNLFYPASGGVKLYKHEIIEGTYQPGPGLTSNYGLRFTFYSTRSGSFSKLDIGNYSGTIISSKLTELRINGSGVSFLTGELLYDGSGVYPRGTKEDNGSVIVFNEYSNRSEWDSLNWQDTVTEL